MWSYTGDTATAEHKDAVVELLGSRGEGGGHRREVGRRANEFIEDASEVPACPSNMQLQWGTVI